MEIKYKDIKDFLEEQGYNWNNVIMINNGQTLSLAKKLQSLENDISLMHFNAEHQVGYIKKDQDLRVDMGLMHFTILAKDEHGGFGIGNSVDMLWVEFLLKRYKQEYANEVKEVSSRVVNNLISDHDISLMQLAIKQRGIEDKVEKCYLTTKNNNLSEEERRLAMGNYGALTSLMISNSIRIAEEKNFKKRELARKINRFNEIQNQISSFGY